MEQHDLSTEIVQRGLESSGPYAGSQSFSVRVRRRMPNFLGSVNLKHVKLGYHYLLNHKIYLITAPVVVLAAALFFRADVTTGGLFFLNYCDNVDASPATKLVVGLAFVAVGFCVYGFVSAGGVRSTYLVDFACYRPPEHLKITRSEFVELAKKSGQFSHEAIEFQHRLLKTSGIGDESYMPRSVFSPGKRIVLREGREEAALVVFGAIDALLASTNINPNTIRILVVNCGVLNTTPSLSAMIINHYKLRPNTNNINLGGMGCSGGVVALDLARDLLHSSSSSPFSFGAYALVVSTEIVSSTWYSGNDFAMLAPNCYLRMGAAAMLVSNRWVDRWRAKYELKQVVRTHRGGVDNNSFGCVELREDASGNQGLWVADQHQLFQVGGNALKANMSTLGPLVLPLKEQLLFFKSLLFNTPTGGTGGPYIPDYKSAFEHVCIGASSNRVLDEVQKNLGLTDAYMDASRSTLRRLGNTSSSSVWYQLEFLEGKRRVRRGHRVWQVAMGSGFKCNSMVWKALRNINASG